MMKYHSDFYRALRLLNVGNRGEVEIDAVVRLSAMGVLPEGWGPGQPLQLPPRIETDEASGIGSVADMLDRDTRMINLNLMATYGLGEDKARLYPIPKYLNDPQKARFRFGRKSTAEMKGLLPALVGFANLTLHLSAQDFMLYDGLRTEQEQRAYVRAGTSKTMQSKHRKQPDGFGHAVDLVPVVGTMPKWDWQLIFPIVAAADLAATMLGIAKNIRWGGAWDRTLADFGGEPAKYEEEIRKYADRHPGKDFLDGPHFEWVS